MSTITSSYTSGLNIVQTDADLHFSRSLIEQTIRDHSTSGNSTAERPLVTGKDENNYPQNFTKKYIHQFANGFDSCLSCGSTYHHFRICSRRTSKVLQNIFCQDI